MDPIDITYNDEVGFLDDKKTRLARLDYEAFYF